MTSSSPPPATPTLRLRDFGIGARAGISCLVLVLLGGYIVAALAHMREHHQNRDGRPGLTAKDIEGVYHGIDDPAPMLTLLEAGHAPDLLDDDREILIRWLAGDNVAANFSNVDFDVFTPEEVILEGCLQCHGRNTAQTVGADIALTSWSDVQQYAFRVRVNPVDPKIMLMSMHAHAPTMAITGLMIALLSLLTRGPRFIINTLILLLGLGLLVDIASWWPARESVIWTKGIIAGGATHTASAALLMLVILLDLWCPKGRSTAS